MAGPNTNWDERQDGLPFYNNSGEEIPPFAVMELDYTGSQATVMNGDDIVFKVKKPTIAASYDAARVLINGPEAVPIDGFGVYVPSSFICVLLDTTGGTPSPGDTLGPVAASWGLGSGDGFHLKSLDISAAYAAGSLESIWVTRASRSVDIWQYQLTTDWYGGLATADKKSMDGGDAIESVTIRDPLSIFDYQEDGDKGYMVKKDNKYYAIQAPCENE